MSPCLPPARRAPAQAGNVACHPDRAAAGGSCLIIFDSAGAMLVSETGAMLVSEAGAGSVVALKDRNGDGVADSRKTVFSGLNLPHGMAFLPGSKSALYVSDDRAGVIYRITVG